MSGSSYPPVVAEFIGHPRESEWYRAYADAKNSVEAARGVAVHERTEVQDVHASAGEGIAVTLHVLRATEVRRKKTREKLDDNCRRQAEDGHLALGIAPFGAGAHEAAEVVYKYVGDAPSGSYRWISGTETLDDLRLKLADWLLLIIDLRFRSAADTTASETVLANEMAETEAGTNPSRSRRFRGRP